MAKGQKRSNKEIRKPKQDKPAKRAASSDAMAPLRTSGAGGFTGKKK